MGPHPVAVREVFDRAAEIMSPTDRAAFLTAACDGDPGLWREVDILLRAHDRAAGFLALPAVNLLTTLDAGPPVADGPPAVAGDGAGGEAFGDFRLVRVIGRGGMGVVYETVQIALGRRVALKVLPAGAHRDPTRRRRFEREARAAARLHHPNIVPVHRFGEHDGAPYFVMQLIPGSELDAAITEPGNFSRPGAVRPPTR